MMKATIIVGMAAHFIPGLVGLAGEFAQWRIDSALLITIQPGNRIRLHSPVDYKTFVDAHIDPVLDDITFIRLDVDSHIKPLIWPTWKLLRYELLKHKYKPAKAGRGWKRYPPNPPVRQRILALQRAAYDASARVVYYDKVIEL